jgi:RNA polymerase sigma-70 factor (ECF subfamily)
MTRRVQKTAKPTGTTTVANSSPRTLGDLLDATSGAARIPEQEWVDIVHAMAAGNEAALRALYDRSHRLAFTLIMRITRDAATAEELTVDVFYDVWRRAAAYDPANGTVLGWILNQARSRALDRLRYQQRQKRVNRFPHEPLGMAEDSGVEEDFDRDELAACLSRATAVLNAQERQAIEAAFFRDMTYAEIAEQAQEPLGTIKTRIRTALAKLRREMGSGREAQ